jgi:hypothetical protein
MEGGGYDGLPGHSASGIDTVNMYSRRVYSWRVPNYRMVMPRIGSRLTLDACRAEAMAIARKKGVRGEPEVESYDGWHSSNGPLSNPQGYIFSWNVDEGHAGEVVAPLDETKPS